MNRNSTTLKHLTLEVDDLSDHVEQLKIELLDYSPSTDNIEAAIELIVNSAANLSHFKKSL